MERMDRDVEDSRDVKRILLDIIKEKEETWSS